MEHSEVVIPIERSDRVQKVLHALADRFTGEPFPAMSDHYRMPDYAEHIQDGTAFDPDDAA